MDEYRRFENERVVWYAVRTFSNRYVLLFGLKNRAGLYHRKYVRRPNDGRMCALRLCFLSVDTRTCGNEIYYVK